MYVWLNVLPAWRRYFAIARRIVISRAVSPAREDEPVEAVVLGLAAPGARERVLEASARTRSARELGAVVVLEPEVVDPDGRGRLRADLVRPLVADPHAHVLEQRQHVGEQDRPPGAKQLEREVVERSTPAERRGSCRGRRRRSSRSIRSMSATACARREVVAVGAGERVAVALEQRAGALLAELLDERVAEVVRPRCASRLGEAGLDLGDVVVGQPRRGSV